MLLSSPPLLPDEDGAEQLRQSMDAVAHANNDEADQLREEAIAASETVMEDKSVDAAARCEATVYFHAGHSMTAQLVGDSYKLGSATGTMARAIKAAQRQGVLDGYTLARLRAWHGNAVKRLAYVSSRQKDIAEAIAILKPNLDEIDDADQRLLAESHRDLAETYALQLERKPEKVDEFAIKTAEKATATFKALLEAEESEESRGVIQAHLAASQAVEALVKALSAEHMTLPENDAVAGAVFLEGYDAQELVESSLDLVDEVRETYEQHEQRFAQIWASATANAGFALHVVMRVLQRLGVENDDAEPLTLVEGAREFFQWARELYPQERHPFRHAIIDDGEAALLADACLYATVLVDIRADDWERDMQTLAQSAADGLAGVLRLSPSSAIKIRKEDMGLVLDRVRERKAAGACQLQHDDLTVSGMRSALQMSRSTTGQQGIFDTEKRNALSYDVTATNVREAGIPEGPASIGRPALRDRFRESAYTHAMAGIEMAFGKEVDDAEAKREAGIREATQLITAARSHEEGETWDRAAFQQQINALADEHSLAFVGRKSYGKKWRLSRQSPVVQTTRRSSIGLHSPVMVCRQEHAEKLLRIMSKLHSDNGLTTFATDPEPAAE